MITKEQAYDALVAMTARYAGDYANTCSWVVKTSVYKTAYSNHNREFKRDTDLVQTARPFTLTEIQ